MNRCSAVIDGEQCVYFEDHAETEHKPGPTEPWPPVYFAEGSTEKEVPLLNAEGEVIGTAVINEAGTTATVTEDPCQDSK